MPRTLSTPFPAALLALLVPASAMAHSDDPKILDRMPRYEGPGYSAALDGDPPVNFPSSNVQFKAWLPISEFGGFANANDCWGYTSPSGREYAILGLSGATAFIEVTEPTDPVVLAVLSGPSSLWRDTKTYQEYAYSVSEGGGGIQVFDMGDIDNGNVALVNTITSGGNEATHNVAIDTVSGRLYRLGGSGNGLRIYDLTNNPASPAFIGSWPTKYVHDAQIVTYTEGEYAGKQIAFCNAGFGNGSIETGLTIVDVTSPAFPQILGELEYSAGAYSHQGWLTEDRQFYILNDELDEQQQGVTTKSRVIDVSDLTNPVEVGTFTNGSSAVDHNCYVVGDLLYAANYRSGLRVFDISDLPNAVEVASFDTFPENDNPNFNGLWSNYPFFESGTVIGSDIEKGLFVWTVGPAALDIEIEGETPDLIDPSGQTLTVRITPAGDEVLDLAETALIFSEGEPDAVTSLEFTPIGDDLYTVAFPPLPCETIVAYYISATTASGINVVLPSGAPGFGTFDAAVADELTVAFEDNMETDTGWVVGQPSDDATTGIWERVDPIGTSAQPESDNPEGEGTLCWITANDGGFGGAGQADVDNGSTTLTSPTLDAASGAEGASPFIAYYRWYSNDLGNSPNADEMPIEISNNDGFTWVPLETVTENTGAWTYRQFAIADFVAPTDQVRVRFIAQDLGDGSLVEAGVDDVRLFWYSCETGVLGDINGDCAVDSADLNILLGEFGQAVAMGQGPDLTGDGFVGSDDLNVLLGAFGQVCP